MENYLYMSRILVTGGAGFIGSNLCAELSNKNTVIALDNLSVTSSNVSFLKDHNVEVVKVDIRDYKKMEQFFKKIDTVFHLAAMNRAQKSILNPIATNRHNVIGTLNVLEAIKKYNVPKIVFTSSSSVYKRKKTPLEENDDLYPSHPYGVDKLSCEHYIRVSSELYKFSYTTVRLFSVYGPRQIGNIKNPAVIASFIYNAINSKPLRIYGTGKQLRNFTFVSDVVRVLENINKNNKTKNQTINIASGEQISINKVAKLINSFTGNVRENLYLPKLNGDPESNPADVTLLKNLVGFIPKIAIENGLSQTINWYQKFNEEQKN